MNRYCGDPEPHRDHAWESDESMEWCTGREFPEPVEATPDEALDVAASYLREAVAYILDGDTEHALVWIDDALLWMGRSQ